MRIQYGDVRPIHISEGMFSQIGCAKDCTHAADDHGSGHADFVLDL